MMKDIVMYKRNKNILLENVDNALPVRILNRLVRLFSSYFAKNPKIVFSERIIEYLLANAVSREA